MARPRAPRTLRKSLICLGVLAATVGGGAGASLLDVCGPFGDVPSAICPYVTELFVLGITVGTSPTTFAPDAPLTRGQGAVFTAKTFDQSAARGGRRAALGEWWTTTPHYELGLGITHVPYNPLGGVIADGADVWAASSNELHNGAVTRFRASDGRVLESWTIPDAYALLAAMGRIFVTDFGSATGGLFVIDPSQAPSSLTSVIEPVNGGISSLAFDGSRLWAAGGGQVLIITPSATAPWPVTVTKGVAAAFDLIFDGSNTWAVLDTNPGSLVRLDANGNVLQTVPVGGNPRFATFDGANIWVPNLGSASVTVVQASTGAVLATLPIGTSPASNLPWAAAFDGQRVLVTDLYWKLWLFKAADLSLIGTADVAQGNPPYQVGSDGTHFFISIVGLSGIGRF
jgi:YVTN family beta-propeller protein